MSRGEAGLGAIQRYPLSTGKSEPTMQELNPTQIAQRLDQLTELSVELGAGGNVDALLERILMVAKNMTAADGGTLYRPSDDGRQLRFHISVNDTLGIYQGGAGGEEIKLPSVPLFDEQGAHNLASVAAYAANRRQSVNIEDVYQADEFNFSGMRSFDQHYQYHSQSFLTVPMHDHEGELVGVLQLINAKEDGGAIRAFSPTDQRFIEALSAQAGVAITNQRLIAQLEELLESLVNLINIGIDEKSPYTGRHCQFVPELTMMLAEAVHNTETGPLAAFRMSDADRKELWLAGLLHDCGKITTPVHVVDKATKLETIFDRIHMVDTRFEVLLRDAERPAGGGRRARRHRADRHRAGRTAGDAARRARLPALGQRRRRRHGGGRSGPRARHRPAALDRPGRRRARLPRRRRSAKPDHQVRHADRGRAQGNQQPHLGVDPHAGVAAVAQAPEERARIRRRPPRAHGRQGLSARADQGPDVGAGALDGDRRYFRGAHRARPAVQEGQAVVGVAAHPRQFRAQRPHRSGPVRYFHAQQNLSAVRPQEYGRAPDRRHRREQNPRLHAVVPAVVPTSLPKGRPACAPISSG